MILSPLSIRRHNLVDPCLDANTYHGISYGLSHAGYDIRVAEAHFIPPGGFELGSSVERFTLPNTIVGILYNKSTWARQGLEVLYVVLEPGWTGYLTFGLANHSRVTISIPPLVGIAQVLFHFLNAPTDDPYTGKYQNQKAGPQAALFEQEAAFIVGDEDRAKSEVR